jgi:uncharacterized membrane protein YhaH (DUF805 family)
MNMKWFLIVLRKYADFTGRAQRAEYWFFTLFFLLFLLALSLVDGAAGLFNAAYGLGLLGGLFALAMILPSIAVSVRRLHDTSRSGWWYLISLIPLIGHVVLLVFVCLDSTPGTNAYGPNPKEAAT